MYAIFEDSGSQLKASVGDVLTIDLRELAQNAKNVTFDRVLLVGKEGGATIGSPYIKGASITAEILERDVAGPKIDVIKFKKRKGYRKKQGHRQHFMKVKVSAIKA